MKTYNKLTETEKNIHSKKTELNFNFELLHSVFKFIFTKLNDPEVIEHVNNLLETFLDNLDNIISKHLSTDETND